MFYNNQNVVGYFMYINSVSAVYGLMPNKTARPVAPKTNINYEKTVEYSLWSTPSFGSHKNRSYTSEIPSKRVNPSKFKITRIPELTCPACGHKILTRGQFTRFLGEIRQAKEEDYIPILEKYEKYMCPTELEVFGDIKAHAKMMEEQGQKPSLTEIVKTLRIIKLPELEKIQLDLVEDMRDAIEPLPRGEKDALNKKLDLITDIIINENENAPFRRKTLIENAQNYQISDPSVKAELLDIAESFPSSKEMACAWIVKNAGKDKQGKDRSPLELAEKLVGLASTSTDHILARNIELNHDDITNYMAMHKSCNSQKTDKSFNEWFDEDPISRRRYLRLYFTEVKDALERGKIKDKKYRDYIKDCVLNIYNLSNGRVDFRSEFCPETLTTEVNEDSKPSQAI